MSKSGTLYSYFILVRMYLFSCLFLSADPDVIVCSDKNTAQRQRAVEQRCQQRGRGQQQHQDVARSPDAHLPADVARFVAKPIAEARGFRHDERERGLPGSRPDVDGAAADVGQRLLPAATSPG